MSNAFEKSSKLESIYLPSFNVFFARSWTLFINDHFERDPCWASVMMLLWCMCLKTLLWVLCFKSLQGIDVNDIGL